MSRDGRERKRIKNERAGWKGYKGSFNIEGREGTVSREGREDKEGRESKVGRV